MKGIICLPIASVCFQKVRFVIGVVCATSHRAGNAGFQKRNNACVRMSQVSSLGKD